MFFLNSPLTILFQKLKKQPPGVLCKKRCSKKFRKINRKTLVPEPLF